MLDWIVAVATVIAILIAAWELRSSARIAGQTYAREAWAKYLELGLENPQFGTTLFAIEKLNLKDVNELYNKGSLETERYWWFLDIMMESCESLVNFFPGNEWQNTIKYNLELHKEAILFRWDDECKFYSDKLCRMVQQII